MIKQYSCSIFNVTSKIKIEPVKWINPNLKPVLLDDPIKPKLWWTMNNRISKHRKLRSKTLINKESRNIV